MNATVNEETDVNNTQCKEEIMTHKIFRWDKG